MGTVTIALSGSSVVNGNKAWQITDADVQTLIDSITQREVLNGRPAPTPAQALVIWAQGFIDQSVARDSEFRNQKAVAAINIPPIVFT